MWALAAIRLMGMGVETGMAMGLGTGNGMGNGNGAGTGNGNGNGTGDGNGTGNGNGNGNGNGSGVSLLSACTSIDLFAECMARMSACTADAAELTRGAWQHAAIMQHHSL